MKTKRNSGFTLIELMIVVAIIGILAAIAIPNFVRYQLKSKEAEAKTVVGGIKTSQEAFRAEFDVYVPAAADGNVGLTNLKVAWVNAPCPAGCTRATPAACNNFQCMGYQPAGPTYFLYTAFATIPGGIPDWTVQAAGNLDGDANLNAWAYGTDNNNTNANVPVNAAAACTIALVAGEVMKCAQSDFF